MIDIKTTRTDLYKSRARILEQYFRKSCINVNTTISCECNVSYIIDNILIDAIYSAIVEESCTNADCVINNIHIIFK